MATIAWFKWQPSRGMSGNFQWNTHEASAFSREDHQIIYKSIVGFLHDGKPVDLILLAEFLDVQGNLDRVGGLPYISELVQCVNTTKNIKAHANSIASASKLRQVKTLLNLITNDSQLTLRALRALVEFSQPYTPALESYLSIDIFD